MNSETVSLTILHTDPRHADRGIARLGTRDMAAIGASSGDIVRLEGRIALHARVMRAPVNEGSVQLDSMQRAQLGKSAGDEVGIRRAFLEPARLVRLRLRGSSRVGTRAIADRLSQSLADMPLTIGETRRIPLVGGHHMLAEVIEMDPSPAAIVTVATRLEVVSSGAGGTAGRNGRSGRSAADGDGCVHVIGYEDLGGLGHELGRVREMVEWPLKRPELFEALGIEPPRGVLLSGPPGSGKTLLARAVANESQAGFFFINGPEIVDRFYGSSEAQLRKVFDDAARSAPSIIFIDEIDSIAPKRADLGGDRQVERRIVAQLLTLMDGLDERGQIVVIAATNLPDNLDPALRRPGRFDRELRIDAPNREGRRQILEIHARAMPLADDVSLDALAARTHGYVGADLAALVREAGIAALRRLCRPRNSSAEPEDVMDDRRRCGPSPGLDGLDRSVTDLAAMRVAMTDFEMALNEVFPSALREVRSEISKIGWSEIGGLEEAKQALEEAVTWPIRYPGRFRHFGLRPARGVLLSGPPGTGKTLLARALAHESACNIIAIKGPELLQRYVGDSERALREVFTKARMASPCILFFDEIDALVPTRGDRNEVGERLAAQLLTELDGIEELRGTVLVAATNRPDLIDPALLRPGRFDRIVEIGLPDRAERLSILKVITRTMPLHEGVDLAKLADATEGLTGAALEGLCREAAMLALRETVQRDPAATSDGRGLKPAEPHRASSKDTIRLVHVDQALARVQGPRPRYRDSSQTLARHGATA